MIRFLIACLMMAVAISPAAAHQQKLAISTVSINEHTGMLEVVHQVPLHDAEHALRKEGTHSPDIIGSEASREAFASYVAERFSILLDGEEAALTFVGSEVSGGSLWVYQEMDAPRATATIAVNSQILTDVWMRQENRVNIGGGTDVETLVFRSGDGFETAELAR